MNKQELARKCDAALNKLCKWRSVFAGWQLGTRLDTDPESKAVRDHREATMLMRVECNALAALLIKKGVFTDVEWTQQVLEEAEHLDAQYQKRFPGFKSTPNGMDINLAIARDTMQGWRP